MNFVGKLAYFLVEGENIICCLADINVFRPPVVRCDIEVGAGAEEPGAGQV